MKLTHPLLYALLLGLLLVNSCEDDDGGGVGQPVDPTEDIVLLTAVTDLSTQAAVTASYRGLPSGQIDVTAAPTARSFASNREGGFVYEGDVYYNFSFAGEPGIQKVTVDEAGALNDGGFIAFNDSQFTTTTIGDNGTGYYFNELLSETAIQTFNPETMQRTGQIDVADGLAEWRENDDVALTWLGGVLEERDGKIYTQAHYLDDNGQSVYDTTFIVTIDVASETIERTSIYPNYLILGYTGLHNSRFVFRDEADNIYLSSFVGNFGEELESHILRIPAGDNGLDPDFDIAFDDFVGGPSFLLGGGSVIDGTIYALLKASPAAADFSNLSDEDIYPHAIDIATGEITRVPGAPPSVFGAIAAPRAFNGKVYMSISNDSYNGYYVYDPATGVSEELLELTVGLPSDIQILDR